MNLIFQKVGDRGNDYYSFRQSYANCVPANPMSDRVQMLLEIYETNYFCS